MTAATFCDFPDDHFFFFLSSFNSFTLHLACLIEDSFYLLVRGRCPTPGEEEEGDYDGDEAIDEEYVVGNNRSNPGLVYVGVDGKVHGNEYDTNRSLYINNEGEGEDLPSVETTMDQILESEWYYAVMRNHPELCR